jgi:hypothetical protein
VSKHSGIAWKTVPLAQFAAMMGTSQKQALAAARKAGRYGWFYLAVSREHDETLLHLAPEPFRGGGELEWELRYRQIMAVLRDDRVAPTARLLMALLMDETDLFVLPGDEHPTVDLDEPDGTIGPGEVARTVYEARMATEAESGPPP